MIEKLVRQPTGTVGVVARSVPVGSRHAKWWNACHSRRARGTIVARSDALRADYAELEEIKCDLSGFPSCQFFKVEAIIRPWRLSAVVDALATSGIRGLTTSPCSGVGSQQGLYERYRGAQFSESSLVEKVKLEVVCVREQVDAVVRTVATSTSTGEIGDGKIFISPVADVVRIRTGETGRDAEHMRGGLEDLASIGAVPEDVAHDTSS